MFKALKGFALAVVMAGTALVSGQAASAEHPAQQLVEDSVAQLLELMRTEGDRVREDRDYLLGKLDEMVVPHLDFVSMTKLSVGKYWRRATDDQKTALVEQFKQFLLNTYTSAVNEYKGGEVAFERFRPAGREDRAVVRSTFTQPSGGNVPVVYKLRDKEGWKIYDIEVEQLSLVTNYRSSFASEIDKNGIDGLISLLKERNGKAG